MDDGAQDSMKNGPETMIPRLSFSEYRSLLGGSPQLTFSLKATAPKILIAALGRMGDVTAATAVAAALRRRFRHAHIVWVTCAKFAEIPAACGAVDIVLTLSDSALSGYVPTSAVREAIPTEWLSACKFDLVLNLQITDFHDIWERSDLHLVPFLFGMAGLPADENCSSMKPVIDVPASITSSVAAWWQFPSVCVVMAVGAITADPWPVACYRSLAAGLANRGLTVLQVGGNQDPPIPEAHDCRGLRILETVEVISRANLFIGNDSGPCWLALSTNTPVIAMMAPRVKNTIAHEMRRVGFKTVAAEQVAAELDIDAEPQEVLEACLEALSGRAEEGQVPVRGKVAGPFASGTSLPGRARSFELFSQASSSEVKHFLKAVYNQLPDSIRRMAGLAEINAALAEESVCWDARHAAVWFGRTSDSGYCAMEVGATNGELAGVLLGASQHARLLVFLSAGAENDARSDFLLSTPAGLQDRICVRFAADRYEKTVKAISGEYSGFELIFLSGGIPDAEVEETLLAALPLLNVNGFLFLTELIRRPFRREAWRRYCTGLLPGYEFLENCSGAGVGIAHRFMQQTAGH